MDFLTDKQIEFESQKYLMHSTEIQSKWFKKGAEWARNQIKKQNNQNHENYT
jgi:hypothetical protein